MLNDHDFLRYQRQIALPEIGESGQVALKNSTVLIIGCGGLGSAAAMYLVAAGVGKLVISDDDQVEQSNLQRQLVYRENDIGLDKVQAMGDQLKAINPDANVRQLNIRLGPEQLNLEVMLADVVLDCSDNLPTRQLINAACYQQRTPLISASAIGWKGQFVVFDFRENTDHGCYKCLVPDEELSQPARCSDSGIIGPVVGTMGNYQALATIQLLATGHFNFQTNELNVFDGTTLQWQCFAVRQDKQCSVCAQQR